jgi:hypothetical protein
MTQFRQRMGRLYVMAAVNWFSACILLVLFTLASYIFLSLNEKRHRERQEQWNLAALQEMTPAAAREFLPHFRRMAERKHLYHPWIAFTEDEYHSPRFNIDPGTPTPTRRTIHQAVAPQAREIWLFGGSTAFGWGVPDDQTIASHLNEILASRNPDLPIRVVNHGHCWYYSSQEVQLLLWKLRLGQRADFAVFLDGLNDPQYWNDRPGDALDIERFFAAASQMIYVSPDFPPVRLSRIVARRVGLLPDTRIEEPSENARVEQVLRSYRLNLETAAAAARSAGMKTIFFWQPTPFDGKEPDLRSAYRIRLNEEVRAQVDHPDFVDISRIFHDEPFDQNYVDAVHYGDRSSRRIAALIADEIMKRLNEPTEADRAPSLSASP